MRKIRIYNYFIRITGGLFLLSSTVLHSQENKKNKETQQHTYPDVYGLNIGTNLLSTASTVFNKNVTTLDFTTDFRVSKKWYAAADLGYAHVKTDEDRMSYSSKGGYLKLGANKNFYANWFDMNNQIYAGGRYAMSFHSQTLESYKILTQGGYIPEYSVNINKTFSNLHSHWLELVVGIRVEVMNHLFMGYSFRIHQLVYQKQPEGFENLYIPGFGYKNSNNIGASFQYSISYLIPFKKKIILF